MRRAINIALISITALATSNVIAQTFPVRVTPVLTPPYTPFLTDYTDPGAERLTLQVMLNDLTVTEFRTKLRMTIEGVGITITTNPNYFPPPISLQGGVPQLIYGSDIADYFKMSNLVFQGLNPNEVQKNGGRLPEGIYRISFEVLDYNRNTVVSNRGSATAWMILNDPPFINLPVNNAKIKPLNPQNIVFQWTPRHRGSPNAAFTTNYDVKLVEIWPAGRNPFDAINTSRPIFETTTSTTMVVYGPAETPLVLGREYALQVRARDNGGRDVFKNNGYSEVVRFIYGDECPMPSGLNADDINISKARMRWQGSGQNSDYLLRYREKKEGARWFEEKTNQSYYNATGLRAGTTYEYQLAGACDIYESEETQIETFTTLTENPNAFVCADPNSVPPPDGSPPLPVLFTNDFIYAGGFDVVVNKATGSNGRFSGEGLAVVPWFNSAKVRVTFENIGVNSSYQLTAGEIKSVWDPNSRSMLVDEKTIAEKGGSSNEFNSDIQTFEPDTAIMVTGVILSAYNDPDGNTVLETNEGRTVLPKGTSYAIADEAGNGYIVDKEGNIKKTTATDALAAGAKANRDYSTDPNLKVIFSRADDTKYGFDEPQTVLPQNYQQTEAGDKVAWKALATGLPDNVVAASQGTGGIANATFKLGQNPQVPSPNTLADGQVQLTLIGKADGTIEEQLAYYPNPDTTKTELVAGKLNVVSYNLVNKNLVLITVNATTTTLAPNSLQTDLNNIYSQGVVQWTVNSTQSINVSGIDENALDDGGSGLLSNYTEDMKKILRAYTADHAMADNTYYLFLVKNSTSQSKLGYMPRKKQAGFIFVDAHNNADVVKTIAHDLGHGAFHLKHTFSEYPSLSQGVTENLMDYPAKTRLDKWQWDHIHNPEKVLGLFEDDEEGALVAGLSNDMVKLLLDGIRDSNLAKEKRFSVNTYAGQTSENMNVSIGKDQLSYLWVKVNNHSINELNRIPLEINPAQREKTQHTKVDNDSHYIKYAFNILDENSNGYNINWLLNNNNLVEFIIERKDEIIFENYLYSSVNGFILHINEVGISNDEIVVTNGSTLKFSVSNQSKNDNNVSFRLTAKDENESSGIQIPSTEWYISSSGQWQFEIESPIEGQYTLQSKIGSNIESIEFWVRPMKFEYACRICGRDLKVTHEKLIKIFPGSSIVQDNPITEDYFMQAIRGANLNTCFRQAHFFSQISHESNGMQATVEGTRYELESMLKTFQDNSNAKSVFFQQDFWDNEVYLSYASKKLYKKLTAIDVVNDKFKPETEITYKWNGSDTYKVSIKKDFSKNDLGEYKMATLTSSEETENGKRLLNLVYSNGVGYGNGDIASGDGFKYRGRGAIQLTGRGNYRAISSKANSLFGANYDWENNPDQVATDLKATVLSASAYIVNRFVKIEVLDQNCNSSDLYDSCVKPISRLINGKLIGLDDRKKRFKTLIEGMYKNCKNAK